MKCVIIYSIGPEWVPGKPFWEQQLVPHRKYLVESLGGKILLAGPFMDHTGGLVVIETDNEEEAIEIAKNDPAVLEGKFLYEVHLWKPLEGILKGENE